MLRILLALLFSTAATLLSAQTCTPDQSYADSTAGVYPLPYDSLTNPTGGITECAVVGEYFQFDLTVVINDTLTVGIFSFALDSIIISEVQGLPVGLTYGCVPTNCHYLKNTINCAFIYGTPTSANAPGAYDMKILGSAYVNGSSLPLPLEFPNASIAPGKYTIHLLANAGDACSVTGVNDLKNNVNITVQPNPADGETLIAINSKVSGQFGFQVVDLLGQVVESRQVQLLEGTNQVSFDAGQLANGLYLVVINSENGFVTKKLAVQH